MNTTKKSFSFGRYLQSIRLEKKISLEKISQETRIAIGNLQLIEKEDLTALPAEVFVKGFLSAFARAIGADEARAVKLYQTRLDVESKLAGAGSFSGRSSLTLWRHTLLSLTAVLSVMLLTLYGVSYFQSRAPLSETAETGTVGQNSQKALTLDEQISYSPKDSAARHAEKLVLQIAAVEDTWVKVIIDNKDPREYNLSSGDHMELEASAGYNLLIGNAAGLILKLNEKTIPIPGKIGEVVSIQLP